MRGVALSMIAGMLGACVGVIGEEEEPVPQSEGQRMFSSTVQPLLRSQCASCHEGAGAGPAFLGVAGATDDYTALVSNGRVVGGFDTGSALLMNKGPHAGAAWWNGTQQTTIDAWLKEEASGHGPAEVTDIMAAWAGCMTFENWDDANMGEWANKRTNQGATCGGCHADGEYGFHANPTNEIMFRQQRTANGISSFFQVSAAGATPSIAPALDKLRNKCSGGNLHPACAVDDQYVDYLTRFAALTRATLAAGLCSEPGYKLLTDPL